MGKSVVLLCTSASKMPFKDGSGDMPTGLWLEEAAASYYVFLDGGCHVTFASVDGGEVPVDAGSKADVYYTPACKKFEEEKRNLLTESMKLADIDLTSVDCLFLAGGHGTCVDFATSPDVKKAIETVNNAGKVVASVCHGPNAFIQCRGKDGKCLVKGNKQTRLLFYNQKDILWK